MQLHITTEENRQAIKALLPVATTFLKELSTFVETHQDLQGEELARHVVLRTAELLDEFATKFLLSFAIKELKKLNLEEICKESLYSVLKEEKDEL